MLGRQAGERRLWCVSVENDRQFVFSVGTSLGTLEFHIAVSEDGTLMPVDVVGNPEGEFEYAKWRSSVKALCEELGGDFDIGVLGSFLTDVYALALDGYFEVEDVEEPREESERLHIYESLFRIAFLLCQGHSLSTVEAAAVMTRNRFTAYRTLKRVEASHFVPLFYDKTTRKWGIIASRHLVP